MDQLLVFTHVINSHVFQRKRLHHNRVQFPEDLVGAPTWPPFLCHQHGGQHGGRDVMWKPRLERLIENKSKCHLLILVITAVVIVCVRVWSMSVVNRPLPQGFSGPMKRILQINATSYRAPVAQLVEHRAVMREVAGSNPGRINTQDLKLRILELKYLRRKCCKCFKLSRIRTINRRPRLTNTFYVHNPHTIR